MKESDKPPEPRPTGEGPAQPPAPVAEAPRTCKCGHSLEAHSYETSGALKPWCDECLCKAFVEAPDAGDGYEEEARELLDATDNIAYSPASAIPAVADWLRERDRKRRER